MEKNIECPMCGSKEIGKGKLQGDARMLPINKLFTFGSEIIADICTNCGYILFMRVKNPGVFK